MPAPGTVELEFLLTSFVDMLGLPYVGIGRRWGPRVPQLRAPTPDALDLHELDRDMERVVRGRESWAQPWHPRKVTEDNRDDVLRRCELWSPPERWHPKRRPSQQMAAAAAVVLAGRSIQDVGVRVLDLRGSVQSHERGTARFRTVRETVERGNRLWCQLGGWPWAAFQDGRPPSDWWQRREALESLARWAEEQACDLERRARRTRGTLTSDMLRGRAPWSSGRNA